MKIITAVLGASLALSFPAAAQFSLGETAPAGVTVPSWNLGTGAESLGPKIHTDTTGRPYHWVPAHGHIGVVIGPVTPDAYGLGIGMDATGKPVKPVTK
jgi:hypothetical protein